MSAEVQMGVVIVIVLTFVQLVRADSMHETAASELRHAREELEHLRATAEAADANMDELRAINEETLRELQRVSDKERKSSRLVARYKITNVNRDIGTHVSGQIAYQRGNQGLPPGTIDLTFTGSAGQSFGAFLPRGITLRLEGDANADSR